jgi:two-component system phosphate regulon sensor histidine kinase PhoR
VILIDNAIKYSQPGGTVAVNAIVHGNQVTIDVKDEGIGIKAADVPHIFDRFYRADASRSKQQADGYGLGLSIAKQIADMHKGQILVKSTSGEGSVFTVKLPLKQS